jgi:benzoyl-CoA reductase subunit BamC
MAKVKKIAKSIIINAGKCIGCRACEVACAAFHARPRYSSSNPSRARIQVLKDPVQDIYLPVYAGEYSPAECAGKNRYLIDGKEYSNCDFCRASCPSRGRFKEPDSSLPLKCDMCQDTPPLAMPKCVEWCPNGTLVYEEREVEVEAESPEIGEVDVSVEAMIDKFGAKAVLETVAKLAKL